MLELTIAFQACISSMVSAVVMVVYSVGRLINVWLMC